MALENSMLVMNGKQVGGNFQDLTGYQTKADNNLETESKEIAGAINELRSEKADTDIVAADFNAGTSYTAGNYCIYEGKFYRFKNSHWGAWAAADVDEIKIAGELASLKSGLTGVQRNMTNVLTGSDAMQSDHNVHEAVLTRNGMIYAGFFNMTLTSAVSAWTPFAHVEANLKYTTLCNGAYGGSANSSYCKNDGNMILTQPVDAGTQIHIVLVGVADFT